MKPSQHAPPTFWSGAVHGTGPRCPQGPRPSFRTRPRPARRSGSSRTPTSCWRSSPNRHPARRRGAKRGEAISLAFVSALQLLPPRQRAVLVLRDVLGFRSREVAAMLDSSQDSVSSALRHARERAPAASISREVRRMDVPDVWVAKHDGSDIVRAAAIVGVGIDITATSPHDSATAKGQP